MSIGVDEKKVDESTPNDLEPYKYAHELKLKEQDEMAWLNGLYVKRALEVVIGSAFGKQVEYMKDSILSETTKYQGMTQEEIDEIELKKMIANEERWMAKQNANGMKKTSEFFNRG